VAALPLGGHIQFGAQYGQHGQQFARTKLGGPTALKARQ